MYLKLILLLGMMICAVAGAQTFNLKPFQLPFAQEAGNYDLNSVLGKKIIVINFFASWCTSCITELPELRALKEKYPQDKVEFLAINAGEKDSTIKKFLKQNNFPYTILKDPERVLSKSMGVMELPRTVVIGLDKSIIFDGNRPPKELL